MNLTRYPKEHELTKLLTRDDREDHHLVWVDKSGEVHIDPLGELTPIGFEEPHPDMKFRLETFCVGNGYVGASAAKDTEWVSSLFSDLTRLWAEDVSGLHDGF